MLSSDFLFLVVLPSCVVAYALLLGGCSKKYLIVITLMLLTSLWHRYDYEGDGYTTAKKLVSTAGYNDLTWKSSQYGFMFSVEGCGIFSPTKLTEFQANKNGRSVSVRVCQWEYIHTPVIVES